MERFDQEVERAMIFGQDPAGRFADLTTEREKAVEMWQGVPIKEGSRLTNDLSAIAEGRRLAKRYGQIDGAHHKTWVIDQMVRALMPNVESYQLWRRLYEHDGHTWDEGIAP